MRWGYFSTNTTRRLFLISRKSFCVCEAMRDLNELQHNSLRVVKERGKIHSKILDAIEFFLSLIGARFTDLKGPRFMVRNWRTGTIFLKQFHRDEIFYKDFSCKKVKSFKEKMNISWAEYSLIKIVREDYEFSERLKQFDYYVQKMKSFEEDVFLLPNFDFVMSIFFTCNMFFFWHKIDTKYFYYLVTNILIELSSKFIHIH